MIMNETELLLEKLLCQYRELLSRTDSVTYALQSSDPETVLTVATAIDETRSRIIELENQLAPVVQQLPQLRQLPQFQERLSLLKQILDLTNSSTPKLKAIMAINRNELKKIVEGRTLINNYYPIPENKGGLINRSE